MVREKGRRLTRSRRMVPQAAPARRTWLAWCAAVVLVATALAGCSAAPTGTTETSAPAPPIVTPSQGQPLSALGLAQGPAGLIWLPAGVPLTYTADQPNLVIAAGPAAQASQVEDYLRLTLPGLGWRITADGGGALTFEQGEWHGGFVTGQVSWALTARND